MIKRLSCLLCAAALPFVPVLAQGPTPTPRPSPPVAVPAPPDEDFVLALTPAGKDGAGVTLIVTSSQTFNISRSGLTFNGTLGRTSDGAYRLDYLLETNATVNGTIHTGSSVILRPGEPVQLVRNGDQFYNLRLDRYPPSAASTP